MGGALFLSFATLHTTYLPTYIQLLLLLLREGGEDIRTGGEEGRGGRIRTQRLRYVCMLYVCMCLCTQLMFRKFNLCMHT